MKLDNVLSELRAEKQWLDVMMQALVAASGAHSTCFIQQLEGCVRRKASSGRGLRITRKKRAELARLAALVLRHAPRGAIAPRPMAVVRFPQKYRRTAA